MIVAAPVRMKVAMLVVALLVVAMIDVLVMLSTMVRGNEIAVDAVASVGGIC